MAFNGSGTFVRLYSWQTDKINGIKVRADRMDGEMDGMATGLSTCITKDGQQIVTANIPFAGFRLINVGAATARTDAARASHLQDQDLVYFTTGGVADTYTLTPAPAVTSYTGGQRWLIKMSAANATTTPTINVSGLGAKTIVNSDGSALAAGDLANGGVYQITYEATAAKFFLTNKPPATARLTLTDGGKQTASFSASANTRYRMKGTAFPPPCAALPGASGAAGDVILLTAYGQYGGQACGTINGTAQTIQFDQQSLWLVYTATMGWE